MSNKKNCQTLITTMLLCWMQASAQPFFVLGLLVTALATSHWILMKTSNLDLCSFVFRCDEIRFQRPCRSHCVSVSSLWAGWGREKRKINFVKFRWCSSHLVIEGKISDILCCCSRFSRYTLTETLKTIVQLSAAQPPAVLQCFQWTVLRWNPA